MICSNCHRKCHRKRGCKTFEKDKDKKDVNAVESAPGLTARAAAAPSVTPSRVSMIELDDWILAVSLDDREEMVGSIEQVMVDSGLRRTVMSFVLLRQSARQRGSHLFFDFLVSCLLLPFMQGVC